MTSRDNIACEWFERVWNGNDVSAIAELAAPDMKAHGADGVTRTPQTFPEFQRAIRAALPDMHIEIPHCVEGGDMVAVHRVAKGTHTARRLGSRPARALHHGVGPDAGPHGRRTRSPKGGTTTTLSG